MRNKKAFSFNEERDALSILTNGFTNGIDYSQMYTVAKYLKQQFSYGAVRLERELIRFSTEQDKNFNPVVEAEAIKKWVRSAMNYDLRKIECISVSKKEISQLKLVSNDRDRKLLFATLILAKALKHRNARHTKAELKVSNNYYVHYNNLLDIIRLSKVKNISEIDLAKIFHKYSEFFTFYNAEKELIRLEYVDKSSDGIDMLNLDDVLEYYNLFFGKNTAFGYCDNCGREIVKNNNKQKYCKTCAALLEKERKARWKIDNKERTVT
jgi:hypothetical protein